MCKSCKIVRPHDSKFSLFFNIDDQFCNKNTIIITGSRNRETDLIGAQSYCGVFVCAVPLFAVTITQLSKTHNVLPIAQFPNCAVCYKLMRAYYRTTIT